MSSLFLQYHFGRTNPTLSNLARVCDVYARGRRGLIGALGRPACKVRHAGTPRAPKYILRLIRHGHYLVILVYEKAARLIYKQELQIRYQKRISRKYDQCCYYSYSFIQSAVANQALPGSSSSDSSICTTLREAIKTEYASPLSSHGCSTYI